MVQNFINRYYKIVSATSCDDAFVQTKFVSPERCQFQALAADVGRTQDRHVRFDNSPSLRRTADFLELIRQTGARYSLVGWRKDNERSAVRPSTRQPVEPECRGQEIRGTPEPHVLELGLDADKLACRSQMRQQVPGLAFGVAPTGFVAGTACKPQING